METNKQKLQKIIEDCTEDEIKWLVKYLTDKGAIKCQHKI